MTQAVFNIVLRGPAARLAAPRRKGENAELFYLEADAATGGGAAATGTANNVRERRESRQSPTKGTLI